MKQHSLRPNLDNFSNRFLSYLNKNFHFDLRPNFGERLYKKQFYQFKYIQVAIATIKKKTVQITIGISLFITVLSQRIETCIGHDQEIGHRIEFSANKGHFEFLPKKG